jgi:hypothetical protein
MSVKKVNDTVLIVRIMPISRRVISGSPTLPAARNLHVNEDERQQQNQSGPKVDAVEN